MKKRYETDGSSIIDTGKRRGRKRVRPVMDDHPQQPPSHSSTPVTSQIIVGISIQLLVMTMCFFFFLLQMPHEQQSSPADFGLDHPSPMYEQHPLMSSRPGSQNSRMSVELIPVSFNPSPAYRAHMSQAKQVCLDRFAVAASNGASSSVGSRAPSASSPEDFADIFSPLKCVNHR